MNHEQRQPARDRPLVAELEKQQDGEQHGARAAHLLERVRRRRLLLSGGRHADTLISGGEGSRQDGYVSENAGDVESRGHEQSCRQAPEPEKDSTGVHGAGGIALIVI